MPDERNYLQQEILNRPLRKHGLLDELNLPPGAVTFIRKNRKTLLAGLVCFFLAILGWSGVDHYLTRQEDQAASMLAAALAETDSGQRETLLARVISGYSRTGAAIWAKAELGHLALDAGRYDDAARIYQEVSGKISKSGPLYPLVQLALAAAHEGRNAPPEALAAYQRLGGIKGFAGIALLAAGRVYESQKEYAKAKDAYSRLLALKDLEPGLKERAQSRLDRL